MRYSELTGPFGVVVTHGSILPSGTRSRKYEKAHGWLEDYAVYIEDGRFYRVGLDCKAFDKRMKRRDFDIDEYLSERYLRRVDADDPWFWRGGKERDRALIARGHEAGQFPFLSLFGRVNSQAGFGAIAFSRTTRKSGWSANKKDQSAADESALGYCEASDAEIVARGHNTFLAFVLADDGTYGWARDEKREDAEKRALGFCTGPNPRIVLLFNTRQGG